MTPQEITSENYDVAKNHYRDAGMYFSETSMVDDRKLEIETSIDDISSNDILFVADWQID